MPGNKRWHFELRDSSAILIFRDGKEISRLKKDHDIPMDPVKEIFYGAEHPQAKSFKAQAIEVSANLLLPLIAMRRLQGSRL